MESLQNLRVSPALIGTLVVVLVGLVILAAVGKVPSASAQKTFDPTIGRATMGVFCRTARP